MAGMYNFQAAQQKAFKARQAAKKAPPKTAKSQYAANNAATRQANLASNEGRYVASGGQSGWKTPGSSASLKNKKRGIPGSPKKGGKSIGGSYSWGPSGGGFGGGTTGW